MKNYVATFALSILLVACGSGTKNSFQRFEKKDPAADAARELEDGNADAAIEILETALVSDKENYQLISLLSLAYSQKYGVSLIDIALNLAKEEESSDGESSETSGKAKGPLFQLWPILPEATEETVGGIDYALSLLRSIPDAARTKADNFKLGLMSVVSVSMQLKALDLNGDGQLSTQELFNLEADSAEAILNALFGAVGAMSGMASEDGNSKKSAEQVSTVYNEISQSEGDNDAERIKSYIETKQK